MVEPYALFEDAAARCRATLPYRTVEANRQGPRREGAAAEIAVTVPPSSVLPAAPSALRTAPGRSVRRRKARSSSDLGEIRGDQSGAVLLAPLPQECKCAIEGGGKAGAAGFGRPCRAQPRPENHAAGTRRHRSESAHAHCPLRSPISRRTPERFCGCAPASASRPTSSSRRVSRPRDRAFRRAGMDYLDAVTIVRHRRWRDFEAWRRGNPHRLVLFTTAATLSYLDLPLSAGRRAAVRPRIGGRAGRGPRRSRRACCHSARAPACARSTSPSPPPWPPAKRCGRRAEWATRLTP